MSLEDKLPYGWEIFEQDLDDDYFIVFMPGKTFKGLEPYDLSVKFEDTGRDSTFLIEYDEGGEPGWPAKNENNDHGPWDGTEKQLISLLNKATRLAKKWSKGDELQPVKRRRRHMTYHWSPPEEGEDRNYDAFEED